MFLEKYQESAGTFWRGTTQLPAKLQTSGSVLTFQEKDQFEVPGTVHAAETQTSRKANHNFSEAATVTFRYFISTYSTSFSV